MLIYNFPINFPLMHVTARDNSKMARSSELSEVVVIICRTVQRFLVSYEEGGEADKLDFLVCIMSRGCIAYYMWSKVTAVSHLSAQKTSPNLVCWCVFAFTCRPTCPLLLVSRRSNAIPRYSIYTHPYGQPPRVHGFYLCALIRSAHSSSPYAQCIQRTGLCVPWTLLKIVLPVSPERPPQK